MVNISGTKMREILGNGDMPDDRVMRPSTAKILADFYQGQA
jgi:ATP sulfurylase